MSNPELTDNDFDGPASPPIGEKVREEFGAVADTAKSDLAAIKEQAAEDVRNVAEQAKEQLGAATDKVKSFAGDQKDLAAQQLGGVAEAITKVANELEGSDQQSIARYARDLAGGLTRASDTVKNNDVDDLMGIAQEFGRNQPLAFLGAAALAGFVASRFALASTHRRENKPASADARPSVFAGEDGEGSNQKASISDGESNNGRY